MEPFLFLGRQWNTYSSPALLMFSSWFGVGMMPLILSDFPQLFRSLFLGFLIILMLLAQVPKKFYIYFILFQFYHHKIYEIKKSQ